MRRFVFSFLALWVLVFGMGGCGGSSFLGLNDRQAYILLTPLAIQKAKLADGSLVGGPVALNAPSGIRSICFRSTTGQLYGMGGDKIVYRINAASGFCTAVSGAALAVDDALGILYSSPDGTKLYYVADDKANYTISPDSGTLSATNTTIAYDPGDVNTNPSIGGIAYSAAGTQLFFLDPANDVLAKMVTPTGGVLNTVGALGVDVAGSSGLAIDPQIGRGYFVCDTNAPGLYEVDLATGASTQIGGASLGGGGIAVIP